MAWIRFFPWTWTSATPQPTTAALGALERVELWSGTLGGGGGRIAVLTPIVSCRTSARIDGRVATSRVTLTLPRSWDVLGTIASALYPRRILRLYDTAGAFEEFRITNVDDSSGRDGMTRVTGIGIMYDLGDVVSLLTQTVNNVVSFQVTKSGTVTSLLTDILTYGPSYVTLGYVASSATVEVQLSNATPLAAAVAVADAASVVDGVEYELSLRQHATGYYLDCAVLNSTATPPDVRTGKNLASLVRGQLSRDMVNRVYPIGTDGLGIGDNWWLVSAVSTNTYIDVQDINGGAHPLFFDNKLNNYYVIDDANGSHLITGSSIQSSTTARLSMASTTGIAVGEWVRIALNSSGDQVAYLDGSGALAFGVATGVIRPTSLGHTNWLKNPDFRSWPGTNPDDWSVTGTSPTKTTTPGFWVSGGQSARMNSASSSLLQTRSIYVAAGGYVTYWLRLYIASNAAGVTVRTRNPETGADDNNSVTTTGEWFAWSRTYQVTTAGAKSCVVGIINGAGPGDLYFDAASITLTPQALEFVRGSGGAILWQHGLQHLRNHDEAQLTYQIALADLTRLDSERWPGDALQLGATMNIRDTDLNLTVSPRIVAVERDEMDRTDTTLTLSTTRPDLARYLAGVL